MQNLLLGGWDPSLPSTSSLNILPLPLALLLSRYLLTGPLSSTLLSEPRLQKRTEIAVCRSLV